MGCDCCNKWDTERDKCTASLKCRKGFCDVTFPREIKEGYGSNYIKPKKSRKENLESRER